MEPNRLIVEEWKKFYQAHNLDEQKILESSTEGREDKGDPGYSCVCVFCGSLGSKKCDRSCCKIGKPCAEFEMREEVREKWKKESF